MAWRRTGDKPLWTNNGVVDWRNYAPLGHSKLIEQVRICFDIWDPLQHSVINGKSKRGRVSMYTAGTSVPSVTANVPCHIQQVIRTQYIIQYPSMDTCYLMYSYNMISPSDEIIKTEIFASTPRYPCWLTSRTPGCLLVSFKFTHRNSLVFTGSTGCQMCPM